MPEVAPGIPQNIAQYLMRLVIPDNSSSINAVITEATAPPERENTYPVILDLDVSRDISIDPADPMIWNIMEDLRSYKNLLFFRTLTSKALDMYR